MPTKKEIQFQTVAETWPLLVFYYHFPGLDRRCVIGYLLKTDLSCNSSWARLDFYHLSYSFLSSWYCRSFQSYPIPLCLSPRRLRRINLRIRCFPAKLSWSSKTTSPRTKHTVEFSEELRSTLCAPPANSSEDALLRCLQSRFQGLKSAIGTGGILPTKW